MFTFDHTKDLFLTLKSQFNCLFGSCLLYVCYTSSFDLFNNFDQNAKLVESYWKSQTYAYLSVRLLWGCSQIFRVESIFSFVQVDFSLFSKFSVKDIRICSLTNDKITKSPYLGSKWQFFRSIISENSEFHSLNI